jgi:uncharacterized protein (DUF2249 family)
MESIEVLDHVAFKENRPVLRTLLPGPGPRVMLLCLPSGQTLPEHAAPDAITVQALSGRTTFYDGTEALEMKSGTLIRLEARRPHALAAHEDSVLLVTVLAGVEPEDSEVETGVLDLRRIPRAQRHPLVFARLEGIAAGQSFTIVNDHDPQPLRRQLEARFIDEIAWDYVERGPDVFRICITRIGSRLKTPASLPEAFAG